MTVHDISDALIARALDAQAWHYGHTPDGQITFTFDAGSFVAAVEGAEGEILVVTALIDAPSTDTSAIDDVLDEWHRTRPWPKAWRDGDGVVAELAGYFPAGLSLEQMRTQLRCAVGSTTALATRLAAEGA